MAIPFMELMREGLPIDAQTFLEAKNLTATQSVNNVGLARLVLHTTGQESLLPHVCLPCARC